MHTPPHSVFLARMPAAAAVALAQSLAKSSRQLPGVSGERQTVDAFAAKWTELTGQWSLAAVAMRMYRLARTTPVTATTSRQWTARFQRSRRRLSLHDHQKRPVDNLRQTQIVRYLFDLANGSVRGVAELGDTNPVATEFQGSDYGTRNYPLRPSIRRDGTTSTPGQLLGLYFVVVSWMVQAAGRRPASGLLQEPGRAQAITR
jgi:hypothetical protein